MPLQKLQKYPCYKIQCDFHSWRSEWGKSLNMIFTTHFFSCVPFVPPFYFFLHTLLPVSHCRLVFHLSFPLSMFWAMFLIWYSRQIGGECAYTKGFSFAGICRETRVNFNIFLILHGLTTVCHSIAASAACREKKSSKTLLSNIQSKKNMQIKNKSYKSIHLTSTESESIYFASHLVWLADWDKVLFHLLHSKFVNFDYEFRNWKDPPSAIFSWCALDHVSGKLLINSAKPVIYLQLMCNLYFVYTILVHSPIEYLVVPA